MASKHLCQPCETENIFVPAVKWCTECEENLCKECFRFHKKGKATKNHRVLDISEAGVFPTLADQHCSKHSSMLLDLFCIDHDALSCRQCMTENHRSCSKLLPLDVAVKDVCSSALVSDLLKDFELSVDAFCSIETAIEKELKMVDDQRIATNRSITTLKTRLQNQIEESALVLSKEIDRVCTEHRLSLLSLQEQEHSFINSKVLYIKRKEELEKIIKHGSNNQIFIVAHQLKLLQTKDEASSINHGAPLNKPTQGICIDRDDNIYVALQTSVVRLSKEGKVLDKNILDKAKGFGGIWAIAFNRTYTQMYAATKDGLQITVFHFIRVDV
ncbi:unnamed protein product [Mytilus coruscus]|uniref:B box-type domain-containing protein n=1 Tax=Mytilus coruscus TaxID=42192 RepID=A0A6J8EUS0_MYTCO|nr:unnamed protein product [Mytilus coruscus]